ncbi:AraC family transcriptional regulator [Aureivirga sp. CE67]|uniref:AraC family transcriptional regulator n=1 Tax=Aureivirga sp. CE67 TaxID=1788983 RepID=UPI0018CBC23A|nr:AraC family transcriptional regulator [Aureivirga sp. CE67]
MRKKEFHPLPIRSFQDKEKNKHSIMFEMTILKPENETGIKVAPHRHDYFHILFIKNGKGKHYIDFKVYDIIPNSIFFVSPGQVHSLEINSEVEGFVVTFNADFFHLNQSLKKITDYPFFHSINNLPYIYLTKQNLKLASYFEDLYEEYSSDSINNDENILRALLELILLKAARIYNYDASISTSSQTTKQLRTLEVLIDNHFKEYKLTEDYAEMLFMTSKALNNICKNNLNKTVINLIHERIIIEAKRLLLFTDNSISEIAYELGFQEKSYFMRFFKKHTSFTAKEFREKNER